MERATPARDVDLFKLSSLHAQFKRKIRATIMELQEEQEQIESQNATFQELQDQVQRQSRKSRLGMDGATNMVFLLLQEIM
jgi:septal ring factor EnvC (AmiA/AmiB activator)